jgi:hypothetical protein
MDSQIDELFFNNITQLSNETNNNNTTTNNNTRVQTEEEMVSNNKIQSKLPLIILGCGLILILFKK